MRILCYPTYEYPTFVEADSSYILMKALKEYFVEKGEFVYLFTPKPISEGDILLNKFKSRDAHEINQYEGIEKFNALDGEFPIDFAVTNNPGKGMELINYFAVTGMGEVKIPVYLWEFSNKFESPDCEQSNLQQENIILHCLAYCFCRSGIFPTKYTLDQTRRMVKKYLSSAMLEKFDRKARVIPFTLDCEKIKQYMSPKDRNIAFYFGGRFTATKKGEQIAKYYDYIFSLGKEVSIKLTVPIIQNRLSKYMKKRGQEFLVHTKLMQEEAWKVMSSCKVSIFEQSIKFLPASPFEQLYAGLVVLFRDHGFEKDVLPPNYPYLYKDEKDCFGMLRWIIDNYDEALSRIKYVPAWIEKNMDRRTAMDHFYNDMKEYVEERGKIRNDQARRVEIAFEDKPEVGWLDMIKRLKEFSRYPELTFAISDSTNKRGIRKVEMFQKMIPDQYEDDCRSLYPNFKKKCNIIPLP